MTRGDLALKNFESGMNCAQAVFLAFSDLTGMEEGAALALSSSFGGGMGRMREVCGAVSGMFMAAGLLLAERQLPSQEEKQAHYARIRELAAAFKAENGSIICRELLEGIPVTSGGVPEERTEAYYKKRPCGEYCRIAANILEEYLESQK